MKATGIIRRIDDLGRIVIPKEIRKNLRIKNGESLEIFLGENENIILTKYSQIEKLKDLGTIMTEAINSVTKKDVLITNTDQFIAVSGSYKRKYLDKPLSNQMLNFISNRTNIKEETNQINFTEEKQEAVSFALCPIIASGDAIGMILIVSEDEPITEKDFEIIQIAASFFAKHIEQ